MRTPFLTVCLGFSLIAACEVGDVGGTGPGDDDGTGGAICGDNVKEGTEACDDGNTTSGDGCSATCTVEAAPKLTATIDKQTVNTELFTTNMLTVTLTSSGGFAGSVALTANAVDAGDVAVPGWTIAIPASVDVPADGQQTAVVTLKVPSVSAGLTGKVKIEATTALGTERMESAVTATKQVTFMVNYNAVNNTCVYPAAAVGTVNVAPGTKLRFFNNDATASMVFHIGLGTGPEIPGVDHQQDTTGPGTAYEQTVAGSTGSTEWYCHTRNNPGNLRLKAVP
jgi:cysteine-rich repeat protein